MATTSRSSTLAILPENLGVMTRIYFAVEQGGALMGDSDILEGVDLAGDVRSLKQRLQASRSRLRDVELDDMMVFGPWEAKPPKAAEWKKKLSEDDAALAPNVALSSLIGATGDYFFIVRITAPPPAAAAGASVLGLARRASFRVSAHARWGSVILCIHRVHLAS